jgi:hypothetical protein
VRGRALLGALRERASELARQVYADLLARIDVSLERPALLLPDIVDLDRKLEFQQRTLPALEQALTDGRHGSLDALLAWLRGEVAAMAPGSDALPAVKEAIAHWCQSRRGALHAAALAAPLEQWARA